MAHISSCTAYQVGDKKFLDLKDAQTYANREAFEVVAKFIKQVCPDEFELDHDIPYEGVYSYTLYSDAEDHPIALHTKEYELDKYRITPYKFLDYPIQQKYGMGYENYIRYTNLEDILANKVLIEKIQCAYNELCKVYGKLYGSGFENSVFSVGDFYGYLRRAIHYFENHREILDPIFTSYRL